MPEEAPVIRATGRLDGGWDSACTCTAYEAGGGLVGTKWLLYRPLSWPLPSPSCWTCSPLGQAIFFRGKEVLLPRHHGQGLAHQESSSTISEPLFQDKLLAKSRQWREEQSPRGRRWCGWMQPRCGQYPRFLDSASPRSANASCMSLPVNWMVAPSTSIRSWIPSA